jgi:sugar lactone lactonase YvrE
MRNKLKQIASTGLRHARVNALEESHSERSEESLGIAKAVLQSKRFFAALRMTPRAQSQRLRQRLRMTVVAAIACLIAVYGCATKPGVIFEPLKSPILWPAAPEPARIRYVGQLSGSADLKPGTQFGEELFGKKPTYSMLTPYAVCTDDRDRLFVADSNAQLVHVLNLSTRKYEQWRPANPEKRFGQPVGIAYDPAGRLYVSDSVASRIYIFDNNGSQIAEVSGDFIQRPCGIAVDRKNHRVLVADTGLHQVVILSPTGKLLARLGKRGTKLGEFNFPTNVAVDSTGRIYVSDSLNFRVQQFAPDFQVTRQIGKKGDMPGYFGQPKGVAVDSEDHLYVVDANFESVQIFNPEGQLLLDFGVEGHNPGEFWLPTGINIDSQNRIWVADSYNRRVQVFDYLPEGRNETR